MREELRANPCARGLFLSPLVMLFGVDAAYVLLAQALFIAAWYDSDSDPALNKHREGLTCKREH